MQEREGKGEGEKRFKCFTFWVHEMQKEAETEAEKKTLHFMPKLFLIMTKAQIQPQLRPT